MKEKWFRTKDMAGEHINGEMEEYTEVNGLMANNKELDILKII